MLIFRIMEIFLLNTIKLCLLILLRIWIYPGNHLRLLGQHCRTRIIFMYIILEILGYIMVMIMYLPMRTRLKPDNLLETIQPHEIYNLAAQSHVRVSFDLPEYTLNVTGMGVLRILNAIRDLKLNTKLYQASSSEMYGASPPPQNESTLFLPRSPYAIAKVMAF